MSPRRPKTWHAQATALAVLGVSALALALVAPMPQSPLYHQFADTRALAIGPVLIPNAADVLSSLAFCAAGLAGLVRGAHAPPSQRMALRVFFVGLVLTGAGSAWYHLDPSNASLFWDRLAMCIAFAGALGALAGERLGDRAARRWLSGWLLLGASALALWVLKDDLRLYVLTQFGGLMVLLIWLRHGVRPGACALPWGWLLVAYGLAKVFEAADTSIWTLSGQLIAGHALKHLAAAAGVIPLLIALSRADRGLDQGSGGR